MKITVDNDKNIINNSIGIIHIYQHQVLRIKCIHMLESHQYQVLIYYNTSYLTFYGKDSVKQHFLNS